MEFEIIIAVIILFLLFFLAMIDMAFAQLSDVSLRRLAVESEENQNPQAAEFLREILENRAHFRFSISSAIQILNIIFTVLVTILVLHWTENIFWVAAFSLLFSLFFSFTFRQVFPRLVIANNPESKLMFLLPIVRPLYKVSSVFVNPFMPKVKTREQLKLEQTFTPDSAEEKSEDNTEDFQALMEVGEAEGIIEEKERELIERMVGFSETRAGEIMTPRTEICAISIDSSIIAARDLIIEEKYSRLPVYQNSIDNVVGVIYVRDLLHNWTEAPDKAETQKIESLLRPAFFVPETIPADQLLKNMQIGHYQLAIVVDEYGGVAGLVTVEDIIEEIVGEIEDEDTEQEEITEIIEGDGGYYDVIGSTEIDKIDRIFNLDIEDEDFTTIAGMVTSELGYVPKTGEKLVLRGLAIEILQADEKRIQLLRLQTAMPADLEVFAE